MMHHMASPFVQHLAQTYSKHQQISLLQKKYIIYSTVLQTTDEPNIFLLKQQDDNGPCSGTTQREDNPLLECILCGDKGRKSQGMAHGEEVEHTYVEKTPWDNY